LESWVKDCMANVGRYACRQTAEDEGDGVALARAELSPHLCPLCLIRPAEVVFSILHLNNPCILRGTVC